MFQILGAIKSIASIFSAIKSVIGFIEANKEKKWFLDSAETFKEIGKAKTDEEYQEAANNLSKLIGRM